VDEGTWQRRFEEGAAGLGLKVPPSLGAPLRRLAEELVRWNEKVNLTAVTAAEEVLEKHLLDSLAALPEVAEVGSLLDIGTGAGFPGLPLRLARPELSVTLVDAVAKKVGFVKHAIAQLGLAPTAKGLHLRVQGRPAAEHLPRHDAAIARALTDVGEWLALASPYVRPGGRVIAMLGKWPAPGELEGLGLARGATLLSERRYHLPFSGAERAIAVFAPGA
jgi:16S rRNA (guanine527-N7)-methyltransferase